MPASNNRVGDLAPRSPLFVVQRFACVMREPPSPLNIAECVELSCLLRRHSIYTLLIFSHQIYEFYVLLSVHFTQKRKHPLATELLGYMPSGCCRDSYQCDNR